jgi:multicomponent Na+:H+ antiporter subunit C
VAESIYAVLGTALIAIGFAAFIVRRHLFWKIIALNIAGTGIFLLLLTLPVAPGESDPVPQAMVLTGIVVAVAATAFALALALRLAAASGAPRLPEEGDGG